jgi:hypothetical protein
MTLIFRDAVRGGVFPYLEYKRIIGYFLAQGDLIVGLLIIIALCQWWHHKRMRRKDKENP